MDVTFEPFDIYDIWYVPFWSNKYIVITVAFIIGLLVIMIWCFLYRKRKKTRILKPWEVTLYKLHSIKLEEWEDRKDFYFELTFLLKRYLIARYHCDLEGKTDQEIIAILSKSDFPKDLMERLEKIFIGAHYIKFAREDVVFSAMEQDLRRAIDIVRNSIPKQL